MLIHENGYWQSCVDSNYYYNDDSLCENLLKFMHNNNIKTLLDLGCGAGYYCLHFLKNGIKCDAYDGNPNTVKISNGIGKVLDFSCDFNLSSKYDCVFSLEVGEHIPKIYEDVFIKNICKHSKRWVIISWAIPGQPGIGHVNCRNNEYIISKVKEYNFNYCKNSSIFLRNNSSLDWFKNTIMVFNRFSSSPSMSISSETLNEIFQNQKTTLV